MELETILRQMTLEDKIALCSGASFWETKKFEKYVVPSLFMCDGPHGLRKQEGSADMLGMNKSRRATCFPAEVTTAASWDPALLEQIGAAIGEEARAQGVGLVLGPGANLKRNPLHGRNFEYFSEDPYLAGKVKGVLYMGPPGQAGGEAIANLLYGRVNPSGRLAESWPLRYADVPSSEIYGNTRDALYMEGVYVCYRDYDKAGVPLRWPFSYGLSYTEFAYSDLTATADGARITVTNTGKRPGAEVVQLYIAAPQDGLHRPLRELKGFAKVFLQPGESKTVSFPLNDRSFAVWQDGWKVPGGRYTVQVGGLSASIHIDGETVPAPAWQQGSWYATCAGKPDRAQWEAMLGRHVEPVLPRKGHFTMDNTVEEMKEHSLVMRIMYRAVEATVARGFGGKKDYENPEFRMMMASSAGSPLRNMQICGGMKDGLMQGLLEMANGHFLRGIVRMLRG